MSAVEQELREQGYAVVPGPYSSEALANVSKDADAAAASGEEVKVGSSTIRIGGILARVPALAALLTHPPLIEAARTVVGARFRLSSFHLRHVRPGAAPQRLHRDVDPGANGWPLVGFILMLDAFAPDNGATRFLPRSHNADLAPDCELWSHPAEQLACGAAGSLILFDGSVGHGHGANLTSAWRRSAQGALIPAHAAPAVDFPRSVPEAVWAGFPPAVRHVVLGIG